MLVSVTRLHLRRWWFFPLFGLYTARTMRQVARSAGFAGGYVAPEPLLGFWTVTVWADEHAMRAYRNSGQHLKAMPRLLDWCDESAYVHWQQDDAALPTTAEAFARLRDSGKLSKVRKPSEAHRAGKAAPRGSPKPGQPITPSLQRR